MGAVMDHRFCSVLFVNKRLFVARQANAGGPGCIVFPMEELKNPDSVQLKQAISSAIAAYFDLGRTIKPAEWEELSKNLIAATGVGSIQEFERKKQEVTIREDVAVGTYALFGSGKSLKNWSDTAESLDEVTQLISKRLLGKDDYFVSV